MAEILEISVEELKEKLDNKHPFILLDVREEDEHRFASIPGAVLIPLGSLPQRLAELDKSAEIVVHCKSGGRSARATEFLCGRGYRAVNVAGGINAWSKRIDPSVPLY